MKTKMHFLLTNTFFFALGTIGTKLIMFFLLPLYTNCLTTSEYGIIELIITYLNLLLPIMTLDIQEAVLRFGLEKTSDASNVLKNALCVIFIGSVLLLLFQRFVFFNADLKQWGTYFIFITILTMFRNVLSFHIKSIGKTKIYAIDNILYTFFLALFNIIFLAYFDWKIDGYFSAMLISSSLSLIFLIINSRFVLFGKRFSIDTTLLIKMIKFSAPLIFNAISWNILSMADRYMLNVFVGSATVGLYSIASKMPSLLTSLTSIFNQAWIISSITEYDTTRDSRFYEYIFERYLCIFSIFASIITIFIEPFMRVYVGHEFVKAWPNVPFLLLSTVFLSFSNFFGAIYTSAKKNTNVMFTTLVGTIVNIVLNYLLIPILGIWGATFSTMLSQLIIFLYRMIDSRKYIKFNISFKKVVFSLVILLIQSIIVSMSVGNIIINIVLTCILVIIHRNTIFTLIVFLNK